MSDFWSGKRVLVTGGSGFVGSFVVEMLLDRGARVAITARRLDRAFRFLPNLKRQIVVFEGDLEDAEVARRAVSDADVLMHLAAQVGGIEYNVKHPASIFYSNMQIFMNLMEAARLEGIGRIMVTSSACVYPRHCSIPTPESEEFVACPEPSNEGYGWAKRMQEFMALAYSREYDMNICIARPYNAYGPRDNFDPSSSHVIPALIRRIEEAENPLVVWGSGMATRSFLYVEDFAAGLIAIAEKSPQVEGINLGADEEITIGDLARLIVQVSGRNVEIRIDSSKPDGQPRRCCDTTLAKQLIGFVPRMRFEEGLHRTIEWYRKNC